MRLTTTELILATLACARLTWLVINDAITEPIRERIRTKAGRRQDKGLAYLITCPWCVSVWVGAACIGWAVVFDGAASEGPLAIAAVSFVASWMVVKAED